MKTIVINASPRKNWNTAQLLQEAKKGAESAGANVEYIELYDLNFTGCRSCMACKVKGAEKCKCFWKDDLTPIIDKILEADNLIIGSPIYFGQPTAQFRALLERLMFCVMAYDNPMTVFKGKINTGFIYTMNASEEYYWQMKPAFQAHESLFASLLNGEVRTYASCDTMQVHDYSKYELNFFSEEAKKEQREEQFPLDLQAAFNMGKEMNQQ